MIVVTHRPCPGGWEFDSDVGDLNSRCKTLEGSVADAEHAVRHYLTRRQGYEVLPDDVRPQVDHVIEAAPAFAESLLEFWLKSESSASASPTIASIVAQQPHARSAAHTRGHTDCASASSPNPPA
jgi:hypothetical protein